MRFTATFLVALVAAVSATPHGQTLHKRNRKCSARPSSSEAVAVSSSDVAVATSAVAVTSSTAAVSTAVLAVSTARSSGMVTVKTTSTTAAAETTTTAQAAATTSSAQAAATTSASSASSGTSSSANTSGIAGLLGSHSGRATFYGGNWSGGACSFSDYTQGSLHGTAMGATQWFGSAACGTCLRVTGSTGSVDVMVVDECPECEEGHLDLFQDISTTVDSNAATDGNFPITWEEIPCAVSGNLQFKNKEGTSAYYFALQVRNSVQPIDSLAVSTDGGSTWTNVERETYNFFTSYSGFGSSPIDIKVTAVTGEVIIQKGLTVSDGSIIQGDSQFSS